MLGFPVSRSGGVVQRRPRRLHLADVVDESGSESDGLPIDDDFVLEPEVAEPVLDFVPVFFAR